MADKRFRGRDKIVQKMTKDGLVEENLRTGETKSAVEEEPPKQEDSEKDAAESAEETPVVEEDVCMDAEDGEEEKPRRSTAKQSTEYYKAHQEDGKAKEKDASPVDEEAEPASKKKGRLSSVVVKNTFVISRFALNDLPEPGVPRISPFGFLSCLRSAIIMLLDTAFRP